MTITFTATNSLPLLTPNRRSLSGVCSLQPSSSPSVPQNLCRSMSSAQLNTNKGLFVSRAAPISETFPSSFSFDEEESEFGTLYFAKYHGLGNDFILIDNTDAPVPKISPEQAVQLCDRNFGVGADGVIFAMQGINGTDYTMRIYNSDGSEPEMCGNGIRCFARFVADLESKRGKESNRFKIHTGAGLIVPEILDGGKVRVDMGEPILKASDVPTTLPANQGESVVKAELDVDGVTWNVTCVSMGNPHCVTFGTKGGESLQVDELSLPEVGPKFEYHNVFPARTNTEFVQIFSPSHLKMRVWERGAGATLACGTGACAVVVAAVLEGHSERKCRVDLPGGPLEIEWREEDNHIYMTGPADIVFYGKMKIKFNY